MPETLNLDEFLGSKPSNEGLNLDSQLPPVQAPEGQSGPAPIEDMLPGIVDTQKALGQAFYKGVLDFGASLANIAIKMAPEHLTNKKLIPLVTPEMKGKLSGGLDRHVQGQRAEGPWGFFRSRCSINRRGA